jgi:hypothetical protein
VSIRIHYVKQLEDGSLEVMIRGNHADADYVSRRLKMEKGVMIGEPKQKEGMDGFIYLLIHSTPSYPFTRERAIQMLNEDQDIEVVGDVKPVYPDKDV